MKIKTRQIDGFLRSPPANIRAVLVYGPDDGLMRERAKSLGKTVVEDINDPFNAVLLNTDQIKDDPARLADEANAMSMIGGKRLVRVENGRDSLSTAVKSYLENPNDQALIVIEAGDLGPRSSLRKLFEKADNAAAVPCYVESERDLAGLIRQTLQDNGIMIERDAQWWLASHIVGDRQRARREIEKLVIYLGNEPNATLDDVMACCGSSGEQSYDDLIFNTGGGKTDQAFRALDQLLEQGIPVIAILRALMRHFRRLHLAQVYCEAGMAADKAMKSLRPPVFFKQTDEFRNQLYKWKRPAIETVMSRLSDLEAQCKQTVYPDETLCRQAILSISRAR